MPDPTMKPRIRPLALCLLRDPQGRLLLGEGRDDVKGETFYRPLGGGIEFGERGVDAVVREIREELDAAIVDVRFAGVVENVFIYNGKPGHEIVLLYDARFEDERFYDREHFVFFDGDEANRAVWKTLDFFRQGRAPLYPTGLLELLTRRPGGQDAADGGG